MAVERWLVCRKKRNGQKRKIVAGRCSDVSEEAFRVLFSIAGCRSFGHPSKALQAMACVLANPPKRESVSCTNVSKRQQYSVSPVAGGLWRTQNNDAVNGNEFAARATVEECSALHPPNAFRSFSHIYNTRLTFRFTRGADSYRIRPLKTSLIPTPQPSLPYSYGERRKQGGQANTALPNTNKNKHRISLYMQSNNSSSAGSPAEFGSCGHQS